MNSPVTKNALIVGGSTGIGLDTAKRLGARGATVTISGRDAAKLETAAAAIKQAGSPKVVAKAVDLYDRVQVDGFAKSLRPTRRSIIWSIRRAVFPQRRSLNIRAKTSIYTMTSTSRFSFSLRRWRDG